MKPLRDEPVGAPSPVDELVHRPPEARPVVEGVAGRGHAYIVGRVLLTTAG